MGCEGLGRAYKQAANYGFSHRIDHTIDCSHVTLITILKMWSSRSYSSLEISDSKGSIAEMSDEEIE